MSTNIKDLVVIVGEYTNKDGETKKQYQTIGKLIEKDDKQSIKIDVIPVSWNGWANIYERKAKDGNYGKTKSDSIEDLDGIF